MTQLPSKAQRDNWNVDRLDKAFIWACSELKAIADNAQEFREWIKIGLDLYARNGQDTNPQVFIRVKLPFDKIIFLQNGSGLQNAVLKFSDTQINETEIFRSSINKNIVDEPSWVDSLEKYVFWLALEIEKTSYPNKLVNLIISLDEVIPFIQIEASFNLYAELFLGGNSFVNSLAQSNQIQSQLLNNSSQLGNVLTVGNN
jgi:hypothetical protein